MTDENEVHPIPPLFPVRRHIHNLRRAFNKQLAMVPVIGRKGAIEAAAYVSIEQFAWSDDWHISEWFNYVLPDFRKSRHAQALLIWERDASENMKKVLWIGVTTE